MRPAALLVLAAGLGTLTVGRAAAQSDARRLVDGLPAEFRRPTVVVYPVLDQRALPADDWQGASAPPAPEPPAWAAFVTELRSRQNLRVLVPAEVVGRIRQRPGYEARLQAAQVLANQGYEDYREVRLEGAIDNLAAAVEAFYAIEHHIVEPRAVARAEVTRGLALLESAQEPDADRAFRAALQIDSRVRLRPGYDRPEAVEAFERARASLLAEPRLPEEFTRAPARGTWPADAWVVRARAVQGEGPGEDARVEVRLLSMASGAVVPEAQPLGPAAEDDGQRLASRVWACLPFGSAPPVRRHRRQLLLDAGFGYFVFTQAPVGLFGNAGAALNLSWLVAPSVNLDGWVSLTNSNRDRDEDLRRDIATVRGGLGPGFNATWGRWRVFGRVGFEAASAGRVVTTRNPACKYWRRDARPPVALCDFDREIDTTPRATLLGAAAAGGASLTLVDAFHLTARVTAAEYFYRGEDSGLGRPVGAELALGYRFF